MKKDRLLNKYLESAAAGAIWSLYSEGLDDIEQVVVVPAYAEREMIFRTLASLAANPEPSLRRTLILCVINNKMDAPAADKENNAQTLELLKCLIQRKSLRNLNLTDVQNRNNLQSIADRPVRLGLVDAASSGFEIPSGVGGVGMARKIGMDKALQLLMASPVAPRLILSLDADTLVRPDYLTAVRHAFSSSRAMTGVIAYEHVLPEEAMERAAICRYEIFLRFWVHGLQYACSPYAFHTIGSALATTAESYLAVRGMNRRAAGEDFYFLNKLAKIGPVHKIVQTVVYPSSRVSGRVPFGTGAAMGKILSGQGGEPPFYDPRVFIILKQWLALMARSFGSTETEIQTQARAIHPELASFLNRRGFFHVWPKIRANLKDEKTWNRQFHYWFDGFETLKMVNDLTGSVYPRVRLAKALPEMMALDVLKGRDQRPEGTGTMNRSEALSDGEDFGGLAAANEVDAEELLRVLKDWRKKAVASAGRENSHNLSLT